MKNQKKNRNHRNTKPVKKIVGILNVNSRGVGFVGALDKAKREKGKELMIEADFLNTALNGDIVEAEILNKKVLGRQTGKISKIVERKKVRFAGTIEKEDEQYFLVPDDFKMYRDILITDKKIAEKSLGHKAIIEIISWKNQKENPIGAIIKVLGKKGEHESEINSIVLEKGFDTEFPTEVEREAKILEEKYKKIPEEEVRKRKDLRGTTTFTIDPIDAKDYDDAISFKKLSSGDLEIGVHIADVSHYVREKTALDKEARKRAFSVYLVDRTIPMLPEALSNGLCSLNEAEEKLTFSAIFNISQAGEVRKSWFGKTVIKSNKRFSYEEAQLVINGEKNGPFREELVTLNKIAKILRAEKMAQGAIDFEQDEIKFVLDEKGVPIKIIKKQRLDTHKLVEEFMLLANKEVAKFIYKIDKNKKSKNEGLLYRVHDYPDKEKIRNLSVFLKALGYILPIKKDGNISPKDINMILNEVAGKAEESLVKTAAVRSMSKAVYATKNIGHFGLAFEYYTHFTSPIRRYPDLLVHRILEKYLTGKNISQVELEYFEKCALSSTEREISAAEAERDSIKYKQVEYMSNMIGQEFDGVISGVTEWGIYVELTDTKSEGMVRLKDIGDDFYSLDEKNYRVIGQKTGKKYSLGDKVRIKVVKADIERKSLDYILV
ncbi:ribonuclease R [Candidatus Nomurabacteria bacterium]|nr:ribonuclease R [Candidatus Nomurabacteria bacterium]